MKCPDKALNSDRDISVREMRVLDGQDVILVREIASETAACSLRYRAELVGSGDRELAVIDAYSADELAELLPRAIACFAATNRLRRGL